MVEFETEISMWLEIIIQAKSKEKKKLNRNMAGVEPNKNDSEE